jgi:5'-3' exonuclease
MLRIDNQGVTIPTGHIYGFLKMICYLRRKFDNPAIIIAIDGYDKQRKVENPEYKANREAKEVNIHAYTDDIIKMCALMPGIYTSYNGSYEADDTIYNISRTLDSLFKKNSIDRIIYIYTQDKDIMQCINDKIVMIKKFGEGKNWLTKAEIVTEDLVREQFNGVRPDRIAMFRSISGGDSSDNIRAYLRFPKKMAALIAEECSIGLDFIYPPAGFCERNPPIHKYLDIINSDYAKFKSNYSIMKMKEYDFTLKIPEPQNASELIEFYQLNQYKKELSVLAGITL